MPNRSPAPARCFPTGRYESRAPVTLGLVIFAATYVLIAVQRLPFVHLNRPAASLLGAVAMVGFGVLPLVDAYAAIDFDVLVFLLGLMLIVGYLEVGKFFEFAAEWILPRARTPERLLFGVVVGGGLLSALFVNDTICLVVTPVLLAALGPLRVRPTPYLIGLAMGANAGSVVSVTGNPQNMLVGIWSGASFRGFLLHLLPVGLGGLAITYGYLRWAYRADLAEPFRERLETVPVALDRPLVVKGLVLFAGAVVAWLAGGPLPLVASAAGVVSGVMAVLSNLISNVPAVMLWRNTVPQLPDPHLVWRVVAMSSTFAGNLLLIGSMANLIVAERAETRGVRIGFGEYARVGVPVTLLTLAWGVVVLVLTP